MRSRLASSVFVGLAFCLSAAANPPVTRDDMIGTWRWVSVDGRVVDQPFYIRYYPDGTCASWPAPKIWSDSKGVSRGRYTVANGQLTLIAGSGTLDPKAKLTLKSNQMIVTNENSNHLVYRRVIPTLEPGKHEHGKQ